MIKVLTILGTRPEAIKLAPVLRALESEPGTFESTVVVTGQHREMLDPMLELFDVRPHHDLAIMTPRQTLSAITCATLGGLEPILEQERPDWVLIQGDTTSAMAAGIASFYHRVNIGHVEAGLRTFDRYSPFPEEINRRVAGVLADLHFAPTPWARANLMREGVPSGNIHMTGNTVIDAMDHVMRKGFDPSRTQLAGLRVDGQVVVVTTHRNENFGPNMRSIATAIRRLARMHPEAEFVYPLHLNPRARHAALRHLQGLPNVSLMKPLEYREMVWLLHHADLVLTDSGGLQEEAAAARTPVLVMRDTTERPEGIEAGIARLVGTDEREIVRVADRLLRDDDAYLEMRDSGCPYGDGQAARRIANTLAGRPASLGLDDHIYEMPVPEHPLDALLRHATADIPPQYAERVLARARDASPVRAGSRRAVLGAPG